MFNIHFAGNAHQKGPLLYRSVAWANHEPSDSVEVMLENAGKRGVVTSETGQGRDKFITIEREDGSTIISEAKNFNVLF